MDESRDWVGENTPRRLTTLRGRLSSFTNSVSRHKRTAATHVFVFMIGTEDRARKPYSLPVQCIPYKGLTDKKMRQLADAVVSEMTVRGMKVAGKRHLYILYCTMDVYMYVPFWSIVCGFDFSWMFYLYNHAGYTTNGEFNSLRTKGRSRPTSILQIKEEVKAKYARMSLKKMVSMLSPKREFRSIYMYM